MPLGELMLELIAIKKDDIQKMEAINFQLTRRLAVGGAGVGSGGQGEKAPAVAVKRAKSIAKAPKEIVRPG